MRTPGLFWIAMAILGVGLLLLVANDDAGSVFGLENEDFGRLVALSALLLVLSAGLFRFGHLGATARGIAIWIVLILGLTVAYQYRYELQDLASRLTMGLVPGSPMMLDFADGTGVRVDRLPSGHFEVVGSVDGTATRFMIDTGATSTVLTLDDARRAGVDTDTLAFDIPVATANGMAQTARVVVDELTVGAISRRRLPVLVARAGHLGQSLLGMNFLGTLSGFEMRGDRLILRD